MRICAYTNLYVPDCMAGAQTMFRDLLRPLRDAGHEVEVAIHRPSARIVPYEWEGIMVYPYVNKRSAIAHITSADVVITTLEATDRACALGDIFDIPVVQIVHNERWGTVERLRKKCDLAVFNSRWVRAALAKEIHGPEIIVHPPVDKADYVVPTRRRTRVTLVNMWPEKGTETFYAAAKALPELRFLGVRGGYGEQDIRDMPNVDVIDQTRDMAGDVYRRTKILLMPSSYDSWGRCAVEAAHNGIPVIAHPTPGLTEALGDGGIFVDRDDHAGWVDEIRRLQDPRQYAAASKRALARAAELEALRPRQLQSFVDGVTYAASRRRLSSRES
jgi:glycosyltransferase involved in cell wall biosynthesis